MGGTPRAEYLYFRLMITYINAKRMNLRNVVRKIEGGQLWPFGVDYLNMSTLMTLAQCFGFDLPYELLIFSTFLSSECEVRDFEAGMILGTQIQETSPDDIDGSMMGLQQL